MTGAIRPPRGEPPKRQHISGIHEPKPEFFEPVTKKTAHLGLRKKKNRFVQRFLKVGTKLERSGHLTLYNNTDKELL
jgi:hypothetical protein